MTASSARGGETASSLVEFATRQEAGAASGIQQMPRDDVMQYIQEMCATLSYMAITHKCERLSGLLADASAEAVSNTLQDAGPDVEVKTAMSTISQRIS